MDQSRAVSIAKWAVLFGVVPLVLAVLLPRTSNPPGKLKPATMRTAMPDFALRDLGGAPWKLSAHRGGVVLENFGATGGAPCREEARGLIRIARRYGGKGLSIAGISMDE